jgi:LacI family transcriptional regulator, galactose operon repressor
MEFKAMNLHDVARKAGVSIATVSRVINGQHVVRGTTRKRVLKALEESNYHPNINARALSVRNNRVIALIVSNLANAYFIDIYEGVERAAHRKGYEVLVADTDYSPERLAHQVRLMLGRRVAGIGVVVSEMDDSVRQVLARSKIPVVVSGVEARASNITSLRVNCEKGMHRLLDHLHSLGHRKMTFVDHHSTLESISERRKAFLEGMARFERAQSRIFTEADSLEGGRQAVRDLLSSGFKPTAVICINDRMAIGVLKELREQGIPVPEGISVTGFDNTVYSEYVSPALTTVHIDREKIARHLFERLTEQKPDPDRQASSVGREIFIDTELVVRESTGPASSRWALPAREGVISHR